MRDVIVLTLAGAVVGLAIGVWQPAPEYDGWVRSAAGGAIACGSFALSGHWLGRLRGRPIGWALGGPVGLMVGGAVWMALLLPPTKERPSGSMIVGGFV